MNKLIGILLAFATFTSSCEYEKAVEKEAPKSVSFKNDVMPMFKQNCLSCHGVNQSPPDLSPSIAYTILMDVYVTDTLNVDNNSLYKRMIDKSRPMPPAGILGKENLDLVRVWILTGAHDN